MTPSEVYANLGWQGEGEGDPVIGKAKAHRGDAEARRTAKIEKAKPRKTLPLNNSDDTGLAGGSTECAGRYAGTEVV